MKKLLILTIALVLLGSASAIASTPQKGTFEAGNQTFLLNGKPFVIRAGEIHFPRIPREYWDHRIKMCKAMGMNTICIYMFWNFHEQQQDKFCFSGQKDVAEFVRLIQKNGMYCIVRPGPYACAEWDMGGLPWWLLKKKDVAVRTKDDAFFMERVERYMTEVGKQLAPLQIQNGGNIIMVQVENEYGAFGNDSQYMATLRNLLRKVGFDKVQLFRCDWSSTFDLYNVDNVATTINFGAGTNINNAFKKFTEKNPTSPKMCSEYWTGWFDNWARKHETRSVSSFIGSLKDMMDQKISFSLYMAHGGTTFGQWGGANCPPYSSMVASYDYNAPINEAGQPTDKFYAVRDLLKNYLNEGETLADIPQSYPTIALPHIELTESASLFANLPIAKNSKDIQPMEMFDQGWGRILYRTTLPAAPKGAALTIDEVHDWALVLINGKVVGKLDRRLGDSTITLPAVSKGARLDIIVENMGRVNFGELIIDRKGITKKVELSFAGKTINLKNWKVYSFPVDYQFQASRKFTKGKTNGPAWYRGTFNVTKKGDTFIDMSTWGKGMVWVNGYNLGRYWKIGPQQTLFMPGCWLKEGRNEIIILDLEGPSKTSVAGLTEPILDMISIDESLLTRKKGQALDLKDESPVVAGTFDAGSGWKTVEFGKVVKGRYFCLEALSSLNAKDTYTSVAELEVIGANGSKLSRAKWKAIYADSEEVIGSNSGASKVYDKQESTFWHTSWTGNKAPHPHQIVIDMGEVVSIKGFSYLTRTDKSDNGSIKDFKFYLKEAPFKL